jgi:hypothetical protein
MKASFPAADQRVATAEQPRTGSVSSLGIQPQMHAGLLERHLALIMREMTVKAARRIGTYGCAGDLTGTAYPKGRRKAPCRPLVCFR